jgi:chromosome segregation ATPase
VRKGRRGRVILTAGAIVSVAVATGLGCAPKTTSCEVSPVELEELREDIAVLQKDLKTAKDRETALAADLAAKQADLEVKRTKPPELRAQLEQVKKGAGKTEKPKETAKETPKVAPKEAPKVPAKEAPKVAPKEAPKVPAKEAPKDSTKKGSS